MAITPSSSASALQGNPVGTTAPAYGQILAWNGTAWVPATTPAAHVLVQGAVTVTMTAWQTIAYFDCAGAQAANAPPSPAINQLLEAKLEGSPVTNNVTVWGDPTHATTIEDPKSPGAFATSVVFNLVGQAWQTFRWRYSPLSNRWVNAT